MERRIIIFTIEKLYKQKKAPRRNSKTSLSVEIESEEGIEKGKDTGKETKPNNCTGIKGWEGGKINRVMKQINGNYRSLLIGSFNTGKGLVGGENEATFKFEEIKEIVLKKKC